MPSPGGSSNGERCKEPRRRVLGCGARYSLPSIFTAPGPERCRSRVFAWRISVKGPAVGFFTFNTSQPPTLLGCDTPPPAPTPPPPSSARVLRGAPCRALPPHRSRSRCGRTDAPHVRQDVKYPEALRRTPDHVVFATLAAGRCAKVLLGGTKRRTWWPIMIAPPVVDRCVVEHTPASALVKPLSVADSCWNR